MRGKTLLLMLLPCLLASIWWVSRPFTHEMAAATDRLAELSPAQRNNIRLAAAALDGRIINPGGLLSFNGVVGPRDLQHGYRPAPSYLGSDSPSTAGGGICLVSSSLYRSALAGGLTIVERTAHQRTVRSIAPGLDATVWYGQTDLKVRNPYDYPLRLSARTSPTELVVSIWGDGVKKNAARLTRQLSRPSADKLRVAVFRASDGREPVLVSRDLYLLGR